MRGKRARQIRRDAIPPDLLSDAKRQIRAAAVERARRTDAIWKTYRDAERTLVARRDRDIVDAYAECDAIRAEILRDAAVLAAARQSTAKAA